MIFNTIVAGSGGIKLQSIAVTTPPTKTSYLSGETFDPTGMVVTATYSNGETLIATGYAVEPSGPLSDGMTSVTIRYTEGGVTATAEQAITVTAPVVIGALNDCTWAQIREISDAGQAANYWSIGDRKAVTLNGTMSKLTLSNFTTYAFIIGFNHNASVEGSNRIHFQIGKTALSGGTDVCLVSGYDNDSDFYMNTSNTNSGGWNNSYMRKTILGTSLSSYSGTFIGVLPAALRAVLKSVTKYTDNTGGGSTAASAVTATTDYAFLLSEYEVFGSISRANSNEASKQAQYDYYKAGNSKVKYNHSATSTATHWWLRSPSASSSSIFVSVGTDGTVGYGNAYYSLGVAPGFCV